MSTIINYEIYYHHSKSGNSKQRRKKKRANLLKQYVIYGNTITLNELDKKRSVIVSYMYSV